MFSGTGLPHDLDDNISFSNPMGSRPRSRPAFSSNTLSKITYPPGTDVKFFTAINKGDVSTVTKILKQFPQLSFEPNAGGTTPLFQILGNILKNDRHYPSGMFSKSPLIPLIKVLIDNGADINDLTVSGQTFLARLCQEPPKPTYQEVAKFIMDNNGKYIATNNNSNKLENIYKGCYNFPKIRDDPKIPATIKSKMAGYIRKNMAGKSYMSDRYNSNAVPISFKAAQLAEERLLAEERALASLSAQPKSGISGLFARSPVGPSILNRQAASNEAKRKQRSEQQIAAFLASARARNAQANANAAKANINARIAAHTSTYSLAGSKAYYPTGLNEQEKVMLKAI
jgi:hypothetical protein